MSVRDKPVRPALAAGDETAAPADRSVHKRAQSSRTHRSTARAHPGLSAAILPSEISTAVHEDLGNDVVQRALSGEDHPLARTTRAVLAHAAAGLLPADGGFTANASLLRRQQRLDTGTFDAELPRSSGSALPELLRRRFQAAFDHDFGHVRVHVDGAAARAARAIHATAFAVGADVFFGEGTWQPGSATTDRLLAHELTHVVQHDEGRLGGQRGVSHPSDPVEREAYANEARIGRMLPTIDAVLADTMGALPPAVQHTLDGALSGRGPGAAPTDALDQACEAVGADRFRQGADAGGGRALEHAASAAAAPAARSSDGSPEVPGGSRVAAAAVPPAAQSSRRDTPTPIQLPERSPVSAPEDAVAALDRAVRKAAGPYAALLAELDAALTEQARSAEEAAIEALEEAGQEDARGIEEMADQLRQTAEATESELMAREAALIAHTEQQRAELLHKLAEIEAHPGGGDGTEAPAASARVARAADGGGTDEETGGGSPGTRGDAEVLRNALDRIAALAPRSQQALRDRADLARLDVEREARVAAAELHAMQQATSEGADARMKARIEALAGVRDDAEAALQHLVAELGVADPAELDEARRVQMQALVHEAVMRVTDADAPDMDRLVERMKTWAEDRQQHLDDHAEPTRVEAAEVLSATETDVEAHVRALAADAKSQADAGAGGEGTGGGEARAARRIDFSALLAFVTPDRDVDEGDEEADDSGAILDEALTADEETRHAMIARMAEAPRDEAEAAARESEKEAAALIHEMREGDAGDVDRAHEALQRLARAGSEGGEAIGQEREQEREQAHAELKRQVEGDKARDADDTSRDEDSDAEQLEDATETTDPEAGKEAAEAAKRELVEREGEREKHERTAEEAAKEQVLEGVGTGDKGEGSAPGDGAEDDAGSDPGSGEGKTAGGGMSEADKDKLEDLEKEKKELEEDIAEHTEAIEDNQEDLEDLEDNKKERIEDRKETQEDLQARKQQLVKEAEEAQAQGEEPPEMDDDSQVKRHQRGIRRIDDKLEKIAREQKEEREDSQEHTEARSELQQRLQEVEQEIRKLQAKSAGGGGGSPLPYNLQATLPGMLAALEARKAAAETALSAMGVSPAQLEEEREAAKRKAGETAEQYEARKKEEARAQKAAEAAEQKDGDLRNAYKLTLDTLAARNAELQSATAALTQANAQVASARAAVSQAEGEAGEDGKNPKLASAKSSLRQARTAQSLAQRQVDRLNKQIAELEQTRTVQEAELEKRGEDTSKLAKDAATARAEREAAEQAKQATDEQAKRLEARNKPLEEQARAAAAGVEDQGADLEGKSEEELRDIVSKCERLLDKLTSVDLGEPNDATVEILVKGAEATGVSFEATRYTPTEWKEEQDDRKAETERRAIEAVRRNHPEIKSDDDARDKIAEIEKKKEEARKKAEKDRKEADAKAKEQAAERERKALADRAAELEKDGMPKGQAAAQAKREADERKVRQTQDTMAREYVEAQSLPAAAKKEKLAELNRTYARDLKGQPFEKVAGDALQRNLDALEQAKKNKTLPQDAKPEDLERMGLTQAGLDAAKAHEEQREADARLRQRLNLPEPGPDAGPDADAQFDKAREALHAEAKRRGCSTADLVKDLDHLPASAFHDPAIQAMAATARQNRPTDVDPQELEEEQQAAMKREGRVAKRDAFARQNDMSPEEAQAYIEGLAARGDLKADEFLDAYDPSAPLPPVTEASMQAMNDELMMARSKKDPKERQAAMRLILQKYGTNALIKAQGIEDAEDRLTGGPVASRGMADIHARIHAIEDPTEKAIALLNAAERHGVSLETFDTAVHNRRERNHLAAGFAKLANELEVPEPKRTEALKQYADENGVTLADLQINQLRQDAKLDAAMDRVKRNLQAQRAQQGEKKKEEGSPIRKLQSGLKAAGEMLKAGLQGGAEGVQAKLRQDALELKPEETQEALDLIDKAEQGDPEGATRLARILDVEPSLVEQRIASRKAQRVRQQMAHMWGLKGENGQVDWKRFHENHRKLIDAKKAYPEWSVQDYLDNVHRMKPPDIRPQDAAMQGLIKKKGPEQIKEEKTREKVDKQEGDLKRQVKRAKRHERLRDKKQTELVQLYAKGEKNWSDADKKRAKKLQKDIDRHNGKVATANAKASDLKQEIRAGRKDLDAFDQASDDVNKRARRARHEQDLALALDPSLSDLPPSERADAIAERARESGIVAEGVADVVGTDGDEALAALSGVRAEPAEGEEVPSDSDMDAELARIKAMPVDKRRAELEKLARRFGSRAVIGAAMRQPRDAKTLSRAGLKAVQNAQAIKDPARRQAALDRVRDMFGLTAAQVEARFDETKKQDTGLKQIHKLRTTSMTKAQREAARDELLAPEGDFSEQELQELEARYEQEEQAIKAQLRAAREADPALGQKLDLREKLRRKDLTAKEQKQLLDDINKQLHPDEIKDLKAAGAALDTRIARDAGIRGEVFTQHEERQAYAHRLHRQMAQMPKPYDTDPAAAETFLATQAERLDCAPHEVLDKLHAVDPDTLQDPELRRIKASVGKERDKQEDDLEARRKRDGETVDPQKRKLAEDQAADATRQANEAFQLAASGEEASSLLTDDPDLPVDPKVARAAIKAYAAENDLSIEDAMKALEEDADAFKRTIAETFAKGVQSPHVRAEMARIRAIEDPAARAASMRSLATITGTSVDELWLLSDQVHANNTLVHAVHKLRDLPSADRQRKLRELARFYDLSVEELESQYAERKAGLDAVAAEHLKKDAQGRLLTEQGRKIEELSTRRDLKHSTRELEALARDLKLPVADLEMLIEERRSAREEAYASKYLGDGTQLDEAKRLAYARGQSLEAFLDQVAGTSMDALRDSEDFAALKALRATLRRADYQARYEDEVEGAVTKLAKGGTIDARQAEDVRKRIFDDEKTHPDDRADMLLELREALRKQHPGLTDEQLKQKLSEQLCQGLDDKKAAEIGGRIHAALWYSSQKVDELMTLFDSDTAAVGSVIAGQGQWSIANALAELSPMERQLWLQKMRDKVAAEVSRTETEWTLSGRKTRKLSASEYEKKVDEEIQSRIEWRTVGGGEDLAVALFASARDEAEAREDGKIGAEIRMFRKKQLFDAVSSDDPMKMRAALLSMTETQRQWAIKQLVIEKTPSALRRLHKGLQSDAGLFDSDLLAERTRGAISRAMAQQRQHDEAFQDREKAASRDKQVARLLFGTDEPDLDMLRDARKQIDRVKKRTGFADENAARVLLGKPLLKDAATPGTGGKDDATPPGEVSSKKVAEKVKALQEELDDVYVDDDVIQKILDDLNPAELAEVQARFDADSAWKEDYDGDGKGLEGLLRDRAGDVIGTRFTDMRRWQLEQADNLLLDDFKELLPKSDRDLTSDAGVAAELDRIEALPAELRAAEMELLAKDLRSLEGKGGADRLRRSLIGDASGSRMLDGQVMEQLKAIDELPAHEREAARRRLARMTGTFADDLEEKYATAKQAQAIGEAMRKLDDRVAGARLAALDELAARHGVSVDEMLALADEAEQAGLLPKRSEQVDPKLRDALADQLTDLRSEKDAATRREKLVEMARIHGLSLPQLLQVAQHEAAERKKDLAVERDVAARLPDVKRAIQEGDASQLDEVVKLAQTHPDRFRLLMRELGQDGFGDSMQGGYQALLKGLEQAHGGWFGDEDRLLVARAAFDKAMDTGPMVDLPPGLDAPTVERMRDDLLASAQISESGVPGPVALAAIEKQLKEQGLSEHDVLQALDGLTALAAHDKKQFDADVALTTRRLEAQLDDLVVEGDALKELLEGASPQVLAAVDARLKDRGGLVALVREKTEFLVDDAILGDARLKIDAMNAAIGHARSIERGERPGEGRAVTAAELDFAWREQALAAALDPAANADVSNEAILAILKTDDESLKKLVGAHPDFQKKLDAALASSPLSMDDIWAGVADQALPLLLATSLCLMTQGPAGLGTILKTGAALVAYSANEANQARSQAVGEQIHALVDDGGAGVRGEYQKSRELAMQAVVDERARELKADPRYAFLTDERLEAIAREEILKDPRKFEAEAKAKQAKARTQARRIYEAMEGFGFDDPRAVHKALLTVSIDEMDLLRAEFERVGGESLDTFLRKEMPAWHGGSDDLDAALKLMDPNRRLQGVTDMMLEGFNAWYGVEDEAFLFDTLEGLSVEERTALIQDARFQSAASSMLADLGENERALFHALTAVDPKTGKAQGNPAHIAAVRIKIAMDGSGAGWKLWEGVGKDGSAIARELSKLTPQQVREMQAYYDQEFGGKGAFRRDVDEELSGKDEDETGSVWATSIASVVLLGPVGLVHGAMNLVAHEFAAEDATAKEIIKAELRGDKLTADAHRLERAAKGTILRTMGWGTDTKLMEEVLSAGEAGTGGRTAAHTRALMKRFDTLYGGQYEGGFRGLLNEELTGVEHAYMKDLAEDGKQDNALALLYALKGFGTRTAKVDEVLDKIAKMSPAEAEAFKVRFRTLARDLFDNDETLDEWIADDISGTEGLEARIKLRGKPESPQDFLEVARMRHDFERGTDGVGGLLNAAIGNPLMDFMAEAGITDAATDFDEVTLDIEMLFRADGTLRNAEDQELVEDLAGLQEGAQKRYRAMRDKAADTIADAVQTVGGVALGVVTGGASWVVQAAATAALALTTSAIKWAIKGRGVSTEEIGTDIVKALADGLTAGLSAKGSFDGMQGGLNELLQDAVGPLLGKIVSPRMAMEMIEEFASEAVEGAIGGLIDAVIATPGALDNGDGAGDILGNLVSSTVLGGLQAGASAALGKGLKSFKGMDEALAAMESGKGLAGGPGDFMKHVGLKFANNLAGGIAGKLTNADFLAGLGDGQGLDAKLVKGLVVDNLVKSVLHVGAKRSTTLQSLSAELSKKRAEDARAKMYGTVDEDGNRVPGLDAELGPEHRALRDAEEALGRTSEASALARARQAYADAASAAGLPTSGRFDPTDPRFNEPAFLAKYPQLAVTVGALKQARAELDATAQAQEKRAAEAAVQARAEADPEYAGNLAAFEEQAALKAQNDRIVDTHAQRVKAQAVYEAMKTVDEGSRERVMLVSGGDPELVRALRDNGPQVLFGGAHAERFEALIAGADGEQQLAMAHAMAAMFRGHGPSVHQALAGPAGQRALQAYEEVQDKAVQAAGGDPRLKEIVGKLPLARLKSLSSADSMATALAEDEALAGAMVQVMGATDDTDAKAAVAGALLDGSGGSFAQTRMQLSRLSGTDENDALAALDQARRDRAAALVGPLEDLEITDLHDGRPRLVVEEHRLTAETRKQLLDLGVVLVHPEVAPHKTLEMLAMDAPGEDGPPPPPSSGGDGPDPMLVRYRQLAEQDPAGAKAWLDAELEKIHGPGWQDEDADAVRRPGPLAASEDEVPIEKPRGPLPPPHAVGSTDSERGRKALVDGALAVIDSLDPDRPETRQQAEQELSELMNGVLDLPNVTVKLAPAGQGAAGDFHPGRWEIRLDPAKLATMGPTEQAEFIGTAVEEARHAEQMWAIARLHADRCRAGDGSIDPAEVSKAAGIPMDVAVAASREPMANDDPARALAQEWDASWRGDETSGRRADIKSRKGLNAEREDQLGSELVAQAPIMGEIRKTIASETDPTLREAYLEVYAGEIAAWGRLRQEARDIDAEHADIRVDYRGELAEEYDGGSVGRRGQRAALDALEARYKAELRAAIDAGDDPARGEAIDAIHAIQTERETLRQRQQEDDDARKPLVDEHAEAPDHDSADAHTETARTARVAPASSTGIDDVDVALAAARDHAAKKVKQALDDLGDTSDAVGAIRTADAVQAAATSAMDDVERDFQARRQAYIEQFHADNDPDDFDPGRYEAKLQGDLEHRFDADQESARQRVQTALVRAASLAGEDDPAVRAEVDGALSRYAIRAKTDPEAARAELEDRLFAAEQGYLQANVQHLSSASRKLEGGATVEELDDDEVQALMRDAVSDARKRIQADSRGQSLEEAMGPDRLGSYCVDARDHMAKRLQQSGVEQSPDHDPVKWHGNHDDDFELHGADLDPRFKGGSNHVWTVFDAGDGRKYLMDPTFDQFQGTPEWEQLMKHPRGPAIADALRKDGFVELDDEVAEAYGRALSRRPDAAFTTDDYADHTYDKHDPEAAGDPGASARDGRFDPNAPPDDLDPQAEKRWRLMRQDG